jgi:hypothetical protein
MGTSFYVGLLVGASIQAFICAFFCSILAVEKGFGEFHDNGVPVQPQKWAFAGFLFGIFAIIAAAGLPDRKYQPGHLPESNQPPTD